MEKAMPLFQKLSGVTMADLVQFYDNFQKTGSVYMLPLMPFDAVNLKLGFEGLCPPGLGIDRYASIAMANDGGHTSTTPGSHRSVDHNHRYCTG